MKRKEFLKTSGLFGAMTPFMFNGSLTRVSMFLDGLELPPNCLEVNDRVVVIVRLAGANDGLNTVIPISQYSTYASIRPTIKLVDNGANGYINLDTTLTANKLAGLHPSMVGFKSLYDAGKLAVLPGVGYPSPNYSHFASENTMFAGKDGNTNGSLTDGIFGRYLAAVFPQLANNPNSQNPDPLAIHMGNSNPNLFYGHETDKGIEYNITALQSQLWNTVGFRNIPAESEHIDLLNYITSIEKSMDVYYNRLFSTFNAGSNSVGNTYSATSLAKQLKTVARLIKGGSKTKIFQVTIGGFDTHVNQIQSGSTHLGTHANLLGDVSASITAFQADLAAMGLEDRVMTATFSEFGRQVRENANVGTDHGHISPFFVIGKHTPAGVLSDHPLIPTTGFQYALTERKFDYRQIFATLLRDWLGANDTIMLASELQNFSTPAQKVQIVSPVQDADPSCLVGTLTNCTVPEETITAIKVGESNGWSYYAPSGYTGNQYLLGIEHSPVGTGANNSFFTASLTFKKTICRLTPGNLVHFKTSEDLKNSTIASAYYFNMTVLTGAVNGYVNIRFFTNDFYVTAVNNEASEQLALNTNRTQSPLLYVKSKERHFNLPTDLRSDGQGFTQSINSLPIASNGTNLGFYYLQFNNVTNIHNSGIVGFRNIATPVNPISEIVELGSIRFNETTKKFEGWNGNNWVNFN